MFFEFINSSKEVKKITKAIVKILHNTGVKFAVLGAEESCTGDPAKRAGNEFNFQMQAIMNIQVLDGYEVKKIVTGCPHCFNTLKNEYPELGGNYDVIHHTQLIQDLIKSEKLTLNGDGSNGGGGGNSDANDNSDGNNSSQQIANSSKSSQGKKGKGKGKKITFHDPCYLGRANDVYEAPRATMEKLDAELVEMKRCKQNGLCCGAGGAQMFKEAEKGDKEINVERTGEAIDTQANIIATGCPFCNTMMTDGVKHFEKESEVKVMDVAELIASAADL